MKQFKDKYIFHAGISCFFYLANGAFTVILSMYCQDIGLTASQIAYILSAAPLLSIATQPFFGYVADKWRSPRKVSILLLLMAGCFMFLFAISRNFWVLLLTSMIACSFMNAVMPLTDRIGVSAPYSFGKIRLWGSVGYAVMAQLSGILYQYISPFSNFLTGILGAGICACCIYMVSDPVISETKTPKVENEGVYKQLLTNRPYVLFVLISFFFWGACMTNSNYLPVFIKSLGGTAAQVGTYQLFATLFEIPMILCTDYLYSKFSFKSIILFSIVVSMINFIWYSTLPNVQMIIYVFVFKGFSTVLFTMVSVKIVLVLIDEKYVSTAYGLQAMLAKGFGPMLFQIIGGKLIDQYSMTTYYLFLLAGISIAFIFTLFFSEKKPISHQNTHL